MTPYSIGDRITLRKPHPCGSVLWNVFRIGADIGLTCDECGRKLVLSRRDLAKRVKSVS
ncbi:MAG: DUF951 domain-containing protein [Chloroflexi bacterium]|nr:DUF951 domain-containing protein [Chloroflexota bacterium]